MRSSVWSLLIHQAVWLGSVLLQGRFLLPAFLLVALHLVVYARSFRADSQMLLSCTVIGVSTDLLLLHSGVYVFDPVLSIAGLPLWLVAIWAAFSLTLRHGLRFLFDRPRLGYPLIAIGAPLSYLAAERLGAVAFPLGDMTTLMVLVPVWIVLVVIFARMIELTDPESQQGKASDTDLPDVQHAEQHDTGKHDHA